MNRFGMRRDADVKISYSDWKIYLNKFYDCSQESKYLLSHPQAADKMWKLGKAQILTLFYERSSFICLDY